VKDRQPAGPPADRLAGKILAAIRLVNGTAGLLAPELLLRRLGADATTGRYGVYPFRMFGIRTILIGTDLLVLRGAEHRRAVRRAVLIHASDTISAVLAGYRGDLPRKAAKTTAVISGVNTVLAVIAARE
jgi:hypothetical protein